MHRSLAELKSRAPYAVTRPRFARSTGTVTCRCALASASTRGPDGIKPCPWSGLYLCAECAYDEGIRAEDRYYEKLEEEDAGE